MKEPPRRAVGGRLAAVLIGLALMNPALAETPASLDLPALLELAERHNPELAAMSAEVEASRQAIVMASAWDDPVLRIEWMGIDPDNPTLAPRRVGEMKYGIEQMLPRWGTRGLEVERAEAGSRQAGFEREQRRLRLRGQVRTAYADWYQARESQRINRHLELLIEQVEQTAQQRYAVGLGAQAEVLRAQAERTMLGNEQLALLAEAEAARAELAGLLNLAPAALGGQPDSLPELLGHEADWGERALARNPGLKALEQQRQAADSRYRQSRLNNRPEVGLGLSAVQMGSELDNVELMLSVRLPLQQGARRAERAEAGAMLARSQALADAGRRELEQAVHGLVARRDGSRQQLELLRHSLLPQAELTFESALAGYATGRVEFAMLLDAQQQIRRLGQDQLMAEVARFRAENALLTLTGEQ